MIALAFLEMMAGAIIFIAGVTGSTVRSVAQGHPDAANTNPALAGIEGEPSMAPGQGGTEGGGAGPQAPGLGLTRAQADAGHPTKAPAPGSINPRVQAAEQIVRRDFPSWSPQQIRERATALLAAQAAGR